MGGQAEGGAVPGRGREGPGATRLRKPPPRVARLALRLRLRRLPSLEGSVASAHGAAARACSFSPGAFPTTAPRRTTEREAAREGKKKKKRPRERAEAARACADSPAPPSLLLGSRGSLPPHSPGTRVRHKEWRVNRTIQLLPSRALLARGGRGGGRDGKSRLRRLARSRHPIRTVWGAVGRGSRRGRGWGRGKGARRLRDQRAGSSRRLKAANQSAPASFGERRGASPPPPRAPGAG